MKAIDPMEHRLAISVQHPPAAQPGQDLGLASCAHHPEWAYQAAPGEELDTAIAEHVQAHADGQDVTPTVGAVPTEARREVVFSVEQGARLEAARILSGAGRLYGKDSDFFGFLREVGQLADLVTYGNLPAGVTAFTGTVPPTALPLDEVVPGQPEPE